MHKSGYETLSPAPDDIAGMRSVEENVNVSRPERWLSLFAGSLLLFSGLRRPSPIRLIGAGFFLYRGASGSCPAYRGLDVSANRPARNQLQIEETLTVSRPVEQVYSMWRQLENLPRYMSHLESVSRSNGQSHWVVKTPVGVKLEWDAAITDEEPNRRIVWTSLPGSAIDHSGGVYFHPLTRHDATEVKVIFSYRPPAGAPGAAVAKMLRYLTEQQIREDIRGFKAIAETGERSTIKGQPSGRTRTTDPRDGQETAP